MLGFAKSNSNEGNEISEIQAGLKEGFIKKKKKKKERAIYQEQKLKKGKINQAAHFKSLQINLLFLLWLLNVSLVFG